MKDELVSSIPLPGQQRGYPQSLDHAPGLGPPPPTRLESEIFGLAPGTSGLEFGASGLAPGTFVFAHGTSVAARGGLVLAHGASVAARGASRLIPDPLEPPSTRPAKVYRATPSWRCFSGSECRLRYISVGQTTFLMASWCFEFRDGDLGLLWPGSRPKGRVMAPGARKEGLQNGIEPASVCRTDTRLDNPQIGHMRCGNGTLCMNSRGNSCGVALLRIGKTYNYLAWPDDLTMPNQNDLVTSAERADQRRVSPSRRWAPITGLLGFCEALMESQKKQSIS